MDFIEADNQWRFVASIVASFDNLDSGDLISFTGSSADAFKTFCDYHGAKYRASLSACRRHWSDTGFDVVTAIGEPVTGVISTQFIETGWGIASWCGLIFSKLQPQLVPTGTPVFRASEVFFCSGTYNRSGSDPDGSISGLSFCWKPVKDEVFKYNTVHALWTESSMAHLVALYGDISNNWFAGVFSPNLDYFFGGEFLPVVTHATEIATDSVQERYLVYANNRRTNCEGMYYGFLPAPG